MLEKVIFLVSLFFVLSLNLLSSELPSLAEEKVYSVGELQVYDFVFQVELKKYKSPDKSMKPWAYNLCFFEKSKSNQVARVLFFIDFETSEFYFWGMYINEEFRSEGLSKPILKFFLAFANSREFKVKTTPQTKPRLAFILQTLGFQGTEITPNSRESRLFLDLEDKENFSVFSMISQKTVQAIPFRRSYEINAV